MRKLLNPKRVHITLLKLFMATELEQLHFPHTASMESNPGEAPSTYLATEMSGGCMFS